MQNQKKSNKELIEKIGKFLKSTKSTQKAKATENPNWMPKKGTVAFRAMELSMDKNAKK